MKKNKKLILLMKFSSGFIGLLRLCFFVDGNAIAFGSLMIHSWMAEGLVAVWLIFGKMNFVGDVQSNVLIIVKKVEFHWFSGRIAAFLYSRLTDVVLHSMEIYCSLFEFGKMNFVEEIKSNVLVTLIIEFN